MFEEPFARCVETARFHGAVPNSCRRWRGTWQAWQYVCPPAYARALLFWQDDNDHGGLLGFATGAYGDAGDPERERWFTRAACAELLIDAGAVVTPYVLNGLLDSRARGLLELFQRKGLLPRTLKFRVALGQLDAVRALVTENCYDLTALNDAFICACRFEHEAVASLPALKEARRPPLGSAHYAARSRNRARLVRLNHHFDVADFLLGHGANINTDWNSHEPASILHHLVFLPNPCESMRFLIDRGIDMTIKDYRWDSNAAGWVRYGKSDEQMAQWLEEAQRERERGAE